MGSEGGIRDEGRYKTKKVRGDGQEERRGQEERI